MTRSLKNAIFLSKVINLVSLWTMFCFSYVIELTSNTDEVPYFKAPPKFLGDKRTAYQHQLSFYLKQTDADNPLDTVQGDVILKGRWFAEDLVYKFDNMRPGEDYSLFSVSIFCHVLSILIHQVL